MDVTETVDREATRASKRIATRRALYEALRDHPDVDDLVVSLAGKIEEIDREFPAFSVTLPEIVIDAPFPPPLPIPRWAFWVIWAMILLTAAVSILTLIL